MNKFSGYSILVFFPLLALAACKKSKSQMPQEELARESHTRQDAVRQPTIERRHQQEEDRKQVHEDKQPDDLDSIAVAAIRDRGIEAVDYLYGLYEGSDRDEAMMNALSRLAKVSDKSVLLERIGKPPPGLHKQKWIWKAMEKGQGGFGEDLTNAISSLEYPEEKQTAINAYVTSTKVTGSADYLRAVEFLQSNDSIGKQFIEGMQDNLLRSYSATLVRSGPIIAASAIDNLPDEQKGTAVGMIARSLSSKNEVTAMSFASSLNAGPEITSTAYSSVFEQLGRTRPSTAEESLGEVPIEFRKDAVFGLVDGWIQQDSKAASQWAAGRSGEDLSAAGPAVVRYLENRGAPSAEIESWRALLPDQ